MKRKRTKKRSPLFILTRLFIVGALSIFIMFSIISFFTTFFKEQEIKAEIESKHQFIEQVAPYAIANYEKYGILPSITIAQAILESNWGSSRLSRDYYNYFGIKSFNPAENRVNLNTQEYYNGQMNTLPAYFRVYDSLQSSVEDHGLLLGTAQRYAKVIQAQNYTEAARALLEASYATDINYPDKLILLIETYQLNQYDPI